MKKLGLIGKTLEHSFSKKVFTELLSSVEGLDYEYDLYVLEKIEDFNNLLKEHPELVGLNVTIPYKSSIINYLDETDEVASAIGAVNTILIKDGKRFGFNTDVFGFAESLTPLLKDNHKKALILGSGGAAKAVAYGCRHLNLNSQIVSRSGDFQYDKIDQSTMEEYLIIINATPLGMFPENETFPNIPYQYITGEHILFDLVYNPENTEFLRKGKEQGAATKNGLEMLHLQAAKSWEIWTG
ncbi:MAG: shikimate dehydrogenase [Bacteroidetes bacterium]|nr:shikimate dehydrogenase [Bacteroidota bacterium]